MVSRANSLLFLQSMLGALVATVASTCATAGPPELFRSTPVFAVGDKPVAIDTCDLNEDGIPDVITANEDFDDVAVLLSDGIGGFHPQVRFGVGQDPRDVACADLNGDRHVDVVTANYDDDTISILRGNGDGTFLVGALTISVQNQPRSVSVGHFDVDDVPDLAIGSTGSVQIFLGTGAFGFSQAPTVVSPGTALGVADLDSDGKQDIFAGYENTDSVQVFWGNGDGTFTIIGPSLVVGDYPTSVTAHDLNGDELVDLLACNRGTHDACILLGLGSRQFAAPSFISVGLQPSQILARDVNGDNFPDILTANEGSNDVSVRFGDGRGSFSSQSRFGAGDNPRGITLADFNGDKVLDAATGNSGSDNVSLLLGNGDGSFRWEPRFGVGDEPRAVVACDLNDDDVPDLISPNYLSDDVSVLIGMGGGTYHPEQRYPVADRPVAIACEDVKEDGYLDLVVLNSASSEVSVLFGIGDGTFNAKPRFSTGPTPLDLAVCDVDGDSHLDVVTANTGDTSILYGDGSGFLLPEIRLPLLGNVVECVDVNNDLDKDLVRCSSSTIYVALGNGDGSFENVFTKNPPSINSLNGVAIGFFNGDNNLDIAVISSSSTKWASYSGNGLGSFAFISDYATGLDPLGIDASDVDLDGVADIVVANNDNSDISTYLGAGDGTFAEQIRYGVGEGPRGISTADVDNDGDDDLIVANSSSDSVSVLFNTAIELPVEPKDFDGDGVVDIDDNCVEVPNSDQADFDGDDQGDACDTDIDNDGVLNGPDVCDFTPLDADVLPNGTLISDVDGDCDVDLVDFGIMQLEFTGPG